MTLVVFGFGVGLKNPTLRHGRHADEWVAQTSSPNRFAESRQHFEIAALRVEGDEISKDTSSCRAVVAGLVLPIEVTRCGVERIELVAAEATAEKHPSGADSRCRKQALPRDADAPPREAAIGGSVGLRRLNFRGPSRLPRRRGHTAPSFQDAPNT